MALVAPQPPLRLHVDAPKQSQIRPPRWGFRPLASRPSASALRRRSPRLGREAEAAAPAQEAAGDVATGWVQLTKQVMLVAMPNIGSNLLLLANEQINVIWLGKTSSAASLAAVGLGNMMQNCLGLSIGWGILAALDSFVSQAYGAGNQEVACAHFQRGRFIATLQLVWIIPTLLSSERLLLSLGQGAEVSMLASHYNRATAPALFCLFQYQALAKFLQNQCITTPPLIINIFTSLLHVVWCTIFVAKMGLGNTGAGYANAMTWTTQWFLISLYVMKIAPKLGMTRRDVFFPGKGTFQEWGKYLKVALPCVLQMSSEWWFWEINALLVGFLGTVPLAAHVAANQFIGLSFMPAMGISSAAAALIGKMLGANRPTDARRYVKACIFCNLLVWLTIALGVLCGNHAVASMYVRPGEVSILMQSLLVIFAFAGLPDTTQHIMSGALRGMGKMAAGSVPLPHGG
ncbi:slc47a1 [Symbiodinium natans]|uniref:Slc47a1 protein n=1 Tax=Symbiodinium natans TaxID=878477 RepID=A0A812MH69_9DINO|nr:slc47a1 [Symbiodinium natans]